MHGKLTISKYNKKDESTLQEYSSRDYEFWEKRLNSQDVLDLGAGAKIVTKISGLSHDKRLEIQFLNFYGGNEDDDITVDHRTLCLNLDQDSALKLVQSIMSAYVENCKEKV